MRTVTFILLSILSAVSCQSHDLVMGEVTYGDVIIFKRDVSKYGFPFIVRESTIEFPEPGTTNYAAIRAIFVKDHKKDDTGGYASVEAGGIGRSFSDIKLVSQRGLGFNFTVTIYGRY